MTSYVGLDVSLKSTSICVVDLDGVVIVEQSVDSDPDSIADFVQINAPGVQRVGLESGPTSVWLWRELAQRGLPVICIDARHARAALSMQINKSDRNDAVGIARIMQTGWYREVQIKSPVSHATRALLNARALLVKIRRDLENQVRGLLKVEGLVIGRAKDGVFSSRVRALLDERPDMALIIEPLLSARENTQQQLRLLERRVRQLASETPLTRTLMTIPGVGPVTALAFIATIDDPGRFRRSRSVGAYLGLTPRRHASGEVDWNGRISKCGDTLVRTYLFEAAGVLLTRVQKWCALKAWGLRIAKRSGMKKARTAVARKLAVILHRMWRDGTEFQWKTANSAS
ncbi:MAG TPA: IS110 family transposase [Gammaproteobacteria bacterium]|nr:IS110 family transposase [Gammaproteobacteria bacterium]